MYFPVNVNYVIRPNLWDLSLHIFVAAAAFLHPGVELVRPNLLATYQGKRGSVLLGEQGSVRIVVTLDFELQVIFEPHQPFLLLLICLFDIEYVSLFVGFLFEISWRGRMSIEIPLFASNHIWVWLRCAEHRNSGDSLPWKPKAGRSRRKSAPFWSEMIVQKYLVLLTTNIVTAVRRNILPFHPNPRISLSVLSAHVRPYDQKTPWLTHCTQAIALANS